MVFQIFITHLNIFPIDLNELISIRSRMFVNESQVVHNFVQDRTQNVALLSECHNLLPTSLAHVARTNAFRC